MIQVSQSSKYRSPLEKKVDKCFAEWNIYPETNFPVGHFEVDFAFPELKLCLEIDGAAYHSSDEQKSRDSYRQKLIEKRGWTFERFDGWFAYKYTDVLVAKIILRYFSNQVNEETIKRAKIKLAIYFKEIDPVLSQRLQKAVLI